MRGESRRKWNPWMRWKAVDFAYDEGQVPQSPKFKRRQVAPSIRIISSCWRGWTEDTPSQYLYPPYRYPSFSCMIMNDISNAPASSDSSRLSRCVTLSSLSSVKHRALVLSRMDGRKLFVHLRRSTSNDKLISLCSSHLSPVNEGAKSSNALAIPRRVGQGSERLRLCAITIPWIQSESRGQRAQSILRTYSSNSGARIFA